LELLEQHQTSKPTWRMRNAYYQPQNAFGKWLLMVISRGVNASGHSIFGHRMGARSWPVIKAIPKSIRATGAARK